MNLTLNFMYNIQTMKYKIGYQTDGFKTIEKARTWGYNFVEWYNNHHYYSGIKFLILAMRHNGEEKKTIKNKVVKKLNPSRFNKGIRNWELTEAVALNPTTKICIIYKIEY